MQHGFLEYMDEVEDDLVTKLLEEVPVERRLRGLSAEELVAGLSEVADLSVDDAARIRELLERKKHGQVHDSNERDS